MIPDTASVVNSNEYSMNRFSPHSEKLDRFEGPAHKPNFEELLGFNAAMALNRW
jgi:hypothetical protein